MLELGVVQFSLGSSLPHVELPETAYHPQLYSQGHD